MTITVQVPDALSAGVPTGSEESGWEIRVAAAIHLFCCALILLGRRAEIAGLSRWHFIEALGRAHVPACLLTSEELTEEVGRGLIVHRQRIAAHPPEQDRKNGVAGGQRHCGGHSHNSAMRIGEKTSP